jgi:hypothetical protein
VHARLQEARRVKASAPSTDNAKGSQLERTGCFEEGRQHSDGFNRFMDTQRLSPLGFAVYAFNGRSSAALASVESYYSYQ